MRLNKTLLIFPVTCPLNLSLSEVCLIFQISLTIVRAWFSYDSKGEWIGGLHSMSESLSKLYLCVDVCVCVCACVWLCLPCLPACLPVDACVQLCVKLAGSSGVMNQIKHTHAHIVTPDQTHTDTHCLWWTELKGPDRVWLWSSPQHPLFHSNTAFLPLVCLTCPSGHLPRTQVTPSRSSNRARCAFKHRGSSCCNWTLSV